MMDLITPELVAVTVYNAAQQMQPDPTAIPEWTDIALLIGTASVESNFELGKKKGRKTSSLGIFGLGIHQAELLYKSFEMGDEFWLMRWIPGYTKKLRLKQIEWKIFGKAWLGINGIPYLPLETRDLRYLMVHDLRFAAVMCKWAYLKLMIHDPETLMDVAEVWNTLYNFDADRTERDFMDAWDSNECRRLMSVVGYT